MLVQIAIIEWLAQGLYFGLAEILFTRFGFNPTPFYLLEVAFVTGIIRNVLLLVAVLIFTRGLRRLWAIAGGWLTFNVLLITVLRESLSLANWLWSIVNGEKLVVADPLHQYVQHVGPWTQVVIWLMMILGSAAIAREINIRFERRLTKSGRIRSLLILALIAWSLEGLHRLFGVEIITWLLTRLANHGSDLEATVNVTTSYYIIVRFAPAALLCILLFVTLRKVRRALRSTFPPPCPDCGQQLVETTANRCPECGWSAP